MRRGSLVFLCPGHLQTAHSVVTLTRLFLVKGQSASGRDDVMLYSTQMCVRKARYHHTSSSISLIFCIDVMMASA